MIVTVTLNPALDLTYAVDALVPHGTHRVSTVAERPGGKGLNVARVLHSLGEPVLATGLLGGTTGGRVAALLRTEGVASSFVDIAGETRRTVAVVDGADATGFWEPGPAITEAEWSRFADHFRSLLREASVITLSGSLPPGLPASAYATLIAYAREAGVPALLDTSGPALRHGLLATPALAKPNADELASLRPPPTSRDRADAPAYGAELAG
ncbi:1-phosphofructokinase family hexose kinase, partial [Paractinoplanes tereljensis]